MAIDQNHQHFHGKYYIIHPECANSDYIRPNQYCFAEGKCDQCKLTEQKLWYKQWHMDLVIP
jgi:hypothetical protein